jgi:diguanylate cyclase (GGDEF)-like protein/PAS domain S-box-containing protein
MNPRELESLFDEFPIAVTYYDDALRLRYANAAWLHAWGLEKSEVIGLMPASFLKPEFHALFAPLLEKALNGKKSHQHRLLSNKEGKATWFENRFEPRFDQSGHVLGVVVMSVNIDWLKHFESDYQALEAVAENTPTPWAYVGADHRYRYVNGAYLSIIGRTSTEVLGRRWDEVLDPDAVLASKGIVDTAMEGQSSGIERLRYDHGSNASRWVRAFVAPDFDVDHKTVKGVYILVQDIHDMKLVEQELKRANERINSHLDQSLIAVIEWNGQLKTVRWSKKAHALFGGKLEPEQNESISLNDFLHPDDRDSVHQLLEPLISGESTATHFIARTINQSGEEICCEWHFSGLHADSGETVSFLSFAQDITARVRAEDDLRRLASQDALTQLPNRLTLEHHATQAIKLAKENESLVAVLFFDLDRFKSVNDTLGHKMGDALLIEIAARMRSAVKSHDIIARQGGDEFIVVMSQFTDDRAPARAVERLLQTLKPPFLISGQVLHVQASVGIALFPNHGHDAETLFRCADTAMYQAKANPVERYKYYQPEFGQIREAEYATETALRAAIASDTIRVYYQPCIDFVTHRVVAVEALARWTMADGTVIPPSTFVATAEQTGLIGPLGENVLRQAAAFAAKSYDISVAVNVSVLQLRDRDFVDIVRRVLETTRCPANKLTLEITESSDLTSAQIVSTVKALAEDVGVRIAIDDFGTGYSNLANLRRLPIRTIKIDRSFVSELPENSDSFSIVRATIALGHSLGLNVVAEGVETTSQRDMLASLHCDSFQGYLVSKPVPEAQIVALIAEKNSLPLTA